MPLAISMFREPPSDSLEGTPPLPDTVQIIIDLDSDLVAAVTVYAETELDGTSFTAKLRTEYSELGEDQGITAPPADAIVDEPVFPSGAEEEINPNQPNE